MVRPSTHLNIMFSISTSMFGIPSKAWPGWIIDETI